MSAQKFWLVCNIRAGDIVGKHQDVMEFLAQKHEILLPLLSGRRLHYLDVPFYGNVGDLLIMFGTLEFFKKHAIPVYKYGMYFNYPKSFIERGDIIVFQGGGNFGDIYGPFQKFREEIIASFPGNRIVILPQSIHFEDTKNFEKCCEKLSRHPDLHICVRDTPSYDMAKLMTPNIYLLPDMAHQLWPLERKFAPDRQVLKLRRRDSETKLHGDVGNTFDWIDLVGKGWEFFLSQVAERCMYHANRLGLNKAFINLEAKAWIWQASRFFNKSVELFSHYERVESDRLHAHILSCLLSIKNDIGDNSYGKNGNYIRQWTSSSDLVRLVDSKILFETKP